MQAAWASVSPPRVGIGVTHTKVIRRGWWRRKLSRGGVDVDAETREHDQERARHSSRELQREGMRRRGREAQGTAASVAGGQEGRVWLQVGVTARVVCAEAVGGGGRERGRGRK